MGSVCPQRWMQALFKIAANRLKMPTGRWPEAGQKPTGLCGTEHDFHFGAAHARRSDASARQAHQVTAPTNEQVLRILRFNYISSGAQTLFGADEVRGLLRQHSAFHVETAAPTRSRRSRRPPRAPPP